MKKSLFNFNLPQELIAQTPIEPRDHSRLLKLNKDVHIVSIKGPIDQNYFIGLKNYSCIYEYTPNGIRTIIKQLKNEINLNGKLPM